MPFKFTRRHGHVWLRARRNDDRILIEVEDECGGLPPDKQQALFQPFTRRGLSRQGVRANGGDIYLRNLPGKGCVFTIELPVANDGLSEAPDPSRTA